MINETALRSPKWMRNFLDFDINTIKNGINRRIEDMKKIINLKN